MIVKSKGFNPRTKVYKARKHKSDISIQLDLSKRRYDLLKEARTRIKDVDSVEYAFADKNCSLGLHLKNGRFSFFSCCSTWFLASFLSTWNIAVFIYSIMIYYQPY